MEDDGDAISLRSSDYDVAQGSQLGTSDEGVGPDISYGHYDPIKSRQAAAEYESGLACAVSRKRGDPLHLSVEQSGATVGFSDALESLFCRVAKRPVLQQVWETSAFLAPLFGSSAGWLSNPASSTLFQFGPVPPLPRIAIKSKAETVDMARKKLALTDNLVFARAIRRFQSLTWPESLEVDRAKALGRWRYIISIAPEQFEVGRIILGDLATGSELSTEETILADVFANKATKTLLTRSGPLILYIQRCKSIQVLSFPILEQGIYTYVCYLRSVGSPASKAASFKSSLAFAMGSLGLAGVEIVLASSRISGAVFSQHLQKPKLKQRRAFYVVEVLWFEELCSGAPDVRDRVFSGYVLFLVFGRPRNGDCAHVSHIIWDFHEGSLGFVEVGTDSAKTSRTVAQRTRFLPLTAPRHGIGKAPWADSWKQARADSGLPDFNPDGSGFPLMPAPLLTGGWSDRPLSAGEVRKWMVELLMLRAASTPTDLLGTRTGKITGLSWMSKVGAGDSTRRFLGYHIAPGDKSMSTYSRDAAAEPLRQFCKMLTMIRLKQFEPDKTRSGYLSESVRTIGFDNWEESRMPSFYTEKDWYEKNPVQTVDSPDSALPENVVQEVATVLPEDLLVPPVSDSEASSSSDESVDADVSLAQDEIAQAGVGGSQASTDSAVDVFFFHDTLTTVHVQSLINSQKLRCGRTVRRGFTRLQAVLFHWPKCKDCFNKCVPREP